MVSCAAFQINTVMQMVGCIAPKAFLCAFQVACCCCHCITFVDPEVADLECAALCIQGNTIVVGRKSPNSLYNEKIASFEDDEGLYDQKDAAGFIKLQVQHQ